MFCCYLHNWFSIENMCPECQRGLYSTGIATNEVVINPSEKQHQENKDWEIVERFPYGEVACDGDLSPIKSVSRLSDGSIWNVGYNTQYGKIKGFYINTDKESYDEGEMMIYFYETRANRALYELQKPLFHSHDLNPQPIYEDNDCWQVSILEGSWGVHKTTARKGISPPPSYFKYFATEEAAKLYVLENKPSLSLREVEDLFNKLVNCTTTKTFPKRLKELLESKQK